jgi:hypothetical protein
MRSLQHAVIDNVNIYFLSGSTDLWKFDALKSTYKLGDINTVHFK